MAHLPLRSKRDQISTGVSRKKKKKLLIRRRKLKSPKKEKKMTISKSLKSLLSKQE
jgi:hypothetical protein